MQQLRKRHTWVRLVKNGVQSPYLKPRQVITKILESQVVRIFIYSISFWSCQTFESSARINRSNLFSVPPILVFWHASVWLLYRLYLPYSGPTQHPSFHSICLTCADTGSTSTQFSSGLLVPCSLKLVSITKWIYYVLLNCSALYTVPFYSNVLMHSYILVMRWTLFSIILTQRPNISIIENM